MKLRRVLLVSGIYFPDIGGPATYLPQLADSLLKVGVTPKVITLSSDITFPIRQKEWEVIRVRREIVLPLRIIKTIVQIVKHSRGTNLIFANGLFVETYIASRISRIPIIAKVVGDPVWERYRNKTGSSLGIDAFQQFELNNGLKFQRKLLVAALNGVTEITCPSEHLKLLISQWGVRRPIHVIPNGVEEILIDHSLKEYDVVSVGRLVSWKNFNLLIEACAKSKLKLCIVGSGPELERLQDFALNTGSDCTFLGQLSSEEIVSVLKSSKVFALLSDYEGLSFALIQAMMAGKRVLVSNIPGNVGVVDNDIDGKYTSLSVDDISNALISLSKESKHNQELEERAYSKARLKYSAKTQTGAMITLMEKNVK